jgi:uncharacterized transporter YbjL
MNKILTTIGLLIFESIQAVAQSAEPEMADTMRSEGKIYVVVAILLTIFAGLIFYLVRIDRKVTRLEKRLQDRKD